MTPLDLLITDELTRRPTRERDYKRELSERISTAPAELSARFVELVRELCDCGSAGLSLLDVPPNGESHFRWTALAGAFAAYVGATVPRDGSPAGMCLDRDAPILLARPARVFKYFNDFSPAVAEILLVPLCDGEGRAIRTIWIVGHEGNL